ncbi:MAG: TRAP transporter small permease [Inquilinaceae bacterium]
MDYRPHYPLLVRLLSGAIDIGLAIGGLSVVALVFTNALLRGAAGFDLAWSLEVTAFLLLWCTFLGCAAAMARGAHMRVTEIVEKLLSHRAQRPLSVLIDLLIVAILASLIVTGVSISSHTWAQKTTVLYWPVGFLYASMPVGMAASLIFHLFNMVHDWRRPGDAAAHPSAHHNDGADREDGP